jgi:hypothetical protein
VQVTVHEVGAIGHSGFSPYELTLKVVKRKLYHRWQFFEEKELPSKVPVSHHHHITLKCETIDASQLLKPTISICCHNKRLLAAIR